MFARGEDALERHPQLLQLDPALDDVVDVRQRRQQAIGLLLEGLHMLHGDVGAVTDLLDVLHKLEDVGVEDRRQVPSR